MCIRDSLLGAFRKRKEYSVDQRYWKTLACFTTMHLYMLNGFSGLEQKLIPFTRLSSNETGKIRPTRYTLSGVSELQVFKHLR